LVRVKAEFRGGAGQQILGLPHCNIALKPDSEAQQSIKTEPHVLSRSDALNTHDEGMHEGQTENATCIDRDPFCEQDDFLHRLYMYVPSYVQRIQNEW
jgi:hypothetical protein